MHKSEFFGETVVIAGQFIKERDYWQKKITVDLPRTYFPYDFERKDQVAQCENKLSRKLRFTFPKIVGERLNQICKQSNIKIHMIFVATIAILLNKYTDNEDIIITIPVLKQESNENFINITTYYCLSNPDCCKLLNRQIYFV